jgi:hypothetical protein
MGYFAIIVQVVRPGRIQGIVRVEVGGRTMVQKPIWKGVSFSV